MLKLLFGGLSAAKKTMHAWPFCKEAAFAASKNPSSILLSIHFWIYSVVNHWGVYGGFFKTWPYTNLRHFHNI